MVDRDPDNLAVFESGAIMIYLAERTGRLLPAGSPQRARALSWLMFQMGGIGPMMGQANVTGTGMKPTSPRLTAIRMNRVACSRY